MRICRRGLSGTDLAIVRALQDGPCEGLHCLAAEISGNPSRLRTQLQHLQCCGLVVIKYPAISGRGYKLTIKKGPAQLCPIKIPGIC